MTAASRYVDYAAVMVAFADLIVEQLESRRVFTRTWRDFNQYTKEDLERGVVCLVSAGVGSYPYEQGATECGRLRMRLAVFGECAPDCEGADIEEAEFSALADIERIATAAQAVEGLGEVKLLRAEQSQQAESPYWWVASEFELFVEGDEDG